MSRRTSRLTAETLEPRMMLAADMLAAHIPEPSHSGFTTAIAADTTNSLAAEIAELAAEHRGPGSELGVAGPGERTSTSNIRLPSILMVPETIVADAHGQFSYEAVFIAGNENPRFAFWQKLNLGNTSVPDVVADGFCVSPMPQGERFVVEISGSLYEPSRPGQVEFAFGTCDPIRFYSQVTTIRPSVDAEQSTIEIDPMNPSHVPVDARLEMVVDANRTDAGVIPEPANAVDTNVEPLGNARLEFQGRLQAISSSDPNGNWTNRTVDQVMADFEMRHAF